MHTVSFSQLLVHFLMPCLQHLNPPSHVFPHTRCSFHSLHCPFCLSLPPLAKHPAGYPGSAPMPSAAIPAAVNPFSTSCCRFVFFFSFFQPYNLSGLSDDVDPSRDDPSGRTGRVGSHLADGTYSYAVRTGAFGFLYAVVPKELGALKLWLSFGSEALPLTMPCARQGGVRGPQRAAQLHGMGSCSSAPF
jgi:hypothetical protein